MESELALRSASVFLFSSVELANFQLSLDRKNDFESPKTKNYVELLSNLKLSDKKTLLVLGDSNNNVYLSSRNLAKAKVVKASELNTYDVLDANNLLFVESSIKEIEKLFSN